jgi:hypothetical protein
VCLIDQHSTKTLITNAVDGVAEGLMNSGVLYATVMLLRVCLF